MQMDLAAGLSVWPLEQLVSIGSHAAMSILANRLFALFRPPPPLATSAMRNGTAGSPGSPFTVATTSPTRPGPKINARRSDLRIELLGAPGSNQELATDTLPCDNDAGGGVGFLTKLLSPNHRAPAAATKNFAAVAAATPRRRPGTSDHAYPVHFMMAVANTALVLAEVRASPDLLACLAAEKC
jgi:hypothetical protein